MDTITIICTIEDAGIHHSVEVLHGEGDSLPRAAFDRYEELIGEFCEELKISANDSHISEGAELNGTWHDLDNPFEADWRQGYVEWRYSWGGYNNTIRVYGDRSRFSPIVKERRVL